MGLLIARTLKEMKRLRTLWKEVMSGVHLVVTIILRVSARKDPEPASGRKVGLCGSLFSLSGFPILY
jgi:hypothetical protein